MSDSATPEPAPLIDEAALHWRRWVLVFWLLACVIFVAYRWQAIAQLGLPDTDDNMRLSQVRALLNGQGWFDLRQYKLDPPRGFDMHWSRVVDLPIAAIKLLAMPFGEAISDRVASAVAPLLPLGVAMFAMALTVRRLVAPTAFAVAVGLMICCQSAMMMFMPMRIDHHGWQLALLVVTIAGLADPGPARGGVTMGVASALSLTIGLELMPFLVICGAAAVLRWVWDAGESARLRGYGAALGIGCILGFLAFASHANRLPRCDVLSPVWMSTMVAAGALAFALSFLRRGNAGTRLAAAAAGGAVLAGGFALIWPQCLGPPEQISPELYESWFKNIREAKPLYAHPWRTAVNVVALPVIGVIGSVWAARAAWRTPSFGAWATVALVSLTSLLLVLWQTRQGPAAQLMGIPGATALAWMIVRPLMRHASMLVRSGGVVAASLLVSGLAVQLAVAQVADKEPGARTRAISRANAFCPSQVAMQAMARLPAATVFTFVDLGPRLITMTPHRAVAGPYHRNGAAILDVHHAFGGTPQAAHAIMHRHRATLLVTCPNMNESTVYRSRTPRGFYSRLAKGEKFAWLTPVRMPKGSPLLVWRIG